MRLVFATQNIGKFKEIKKILKDFNFFQDFDLKILSAKEAGIFEDILEDGKTFQDNALKKASFVAKRSREWSVADDSGICIKELGGAPGILSSRWTGERATDKDLISYTLEKMKNIPKEKRQAYFETALALVSPDGKHWIFKGRVDGKIATSPRGKSRSNLPYDDIFIPRGFNKTFAEMTDVQKNEISHRGLAFQKLKKFLQLNFKK